MSPHYGGSKLLYLGGNIDENAKKISKIFLALWYTLIGRLLWHVGCYVKGAKWLYKAYDVVPDIMDKRLPEDTLILLISMK